MYSAYCAKLNSMASVCPVALPQRLEVDGAVLCHALQVEASSVTEACTELARQCPDPASGPSGGLKGAWSELAGTRRFCFADPDVRFAQGDNAFEKLSDCVITEKTLICDLADGAGKQTIHWSVLGNRLVLEIPAAPGLTCVNDCLHYFQADTMSRCSAS